MLTDTKENSRVCQLHHCSKNKTSIYTELGKLLAQM